MIYFDTESVGFYGQPVLLQWAMDDGEIYLYELWCNKISDTLELLESIANHKGGVCGFNLTFDSFQINKIYNLFCTAIKVYPGAKDWFPDEHIEELACVEKQSRDGVCWKPVKALDLFLLARKGEYQSLLDRKDIRIKRVPKQLAQPLANELHKRIKFNAVYFARKKTKLDNPWQVTPNYIKGDKKAEDPEFRDIVLKFAPSSGLKALAVDVGLVKEEDIMKFTDVECPLYPKELGWAPFAEALGSPGQWNGTWPDVIKWHIKHFSQHESAREYSRLDIVYTRGLHKFFGSPPAGDDDSELACAIGAIRWKGFAIDVPALRQLREKALLLQKTAPKDPRSVKKWIWPDLEPSEQEATGGSTGKIVLEDMATWKMDCPQCRGEGTQISSLSETDDLVSCSNCRGSGLIAHPAAIKAKCVLDARKAKKETEIYDKLIQAGRFHASFKIIGTLSGRMAGADKLNPQGIKSTKEVRSCFPLGYAEDAEELCGGDFESFEVVIAVAIYKDPKLESDLKDFGMCPGCLGSCKTKKGNSCPECGGSGKAKKKIHGLFGEVLFKKNYDEIVASKGTAHDMYTDGKRGVFSQLYGGNYATLMDRLGISETIAIEAAEGWGRRYPGIKRAQQRIANMFGTMVQKAGLGSQITWKDPERYISSLLGFCRYYDLENKICKVLFDLAEKPPKEWTNLKITVRRRDRDQTASGAVRSALFGAAFQIQSANIRSATNHEIQSTGAGICKRVQRLIWDLQPSGVHSWVVRVLNIHDELMVPCKKETKIIVEAVVRKAVESYKALIPMISIDWSNELKTWADK